MPENDRHVGRQTYINNLQAPVLGVEFLDLLCYCPPVAVPPLLTGPLLPLPPTDPLQLSLGGQHILLGRTERKALLHRLHCYTFCMSQSTSVSREQQPTYPTTGSTKVVRFNPKTIAKHNLIWYPNYSIPNFFIGVGAYTLLFMLRMRL